MLADCPSVHPRMRGEHSSPNIVRSWSFGSSPHARGTPSLFPSALRDGPVHPRMRGEHATATPTLLLCIGSSPHARGTPSRTRKPPPHRAVHPRMRGEHLDLLEYVEAAIRFIPACAGNTRSSTPTFRGLPVHPRMRGEHRVAGGDVMPAAGSSPHARGTHAERLETALVGRFIPACAGNTADAAPWFGGGSVHPRMRGEHLRFSQRSCGPSGSSPHARGTLFP